MSGKEIARIWWFLFTNGHKDITVQEIRAAVEFARNDD